MAASAAEEESWECSLLPPRRSVQARRKRELPASSEKTIALNDEVVKAVASPLKAASTPAAAKQGQKAELLSLELKNFKCFEDRTVSFGSACSCIVGPNSSGKSSIMDAINFVTLRPVKSLRGLVRRCRPAMLQCSVIAVFKTERSGKVVLRRSLSLDSPKLHTVTCAVGFEGQVKDVSESEYASWVENVICWRESDVIMNQDSLIEQSSLKQLLHKLPKALDRLEAEAPISAPTLKRRCISSKSSNAVSRVTGIRTKAEAWVSRRVDELYCELSRVPVDEHFQNWGEGGQACLKKLSDGSFTIFVSHRRGLAALGKGVPLESLSDGDHDLCALALLLTLPGLCSGAMQDALPPLVIFDGPDSRLDRRGALCLQRLLSCRGAPAQCILLSLNNHRAFKDLPGTMLLPELPAQTLEHADPGSDDDDPYGDVRPRRKAALKA